MTPEPTGSTAGSRPEPARRLLADRPERHGVAGQPGARHGRPRRAGVLLLFALVLSPSDAGPNASVNEIGEIVRIIYVHVPIAIACFLAFAVTAFGSVMCALEEARVVGPPGRRVGRDRRGLHRAHAGHRLDLWGHVAWGTYWVWDARLTSTALLFVLLARLPGPAPGDHRPARSGPAARAIVGLLAFADVPDRALLGRLVALPAPGGHDHPLRPDDRRHRAVHADARHGRVPGRVRLAADPPLPAPVGAGPRWRTRARRRARSERRAEAPAGSAPPSGGAPVVIARRQPVGLRRGRGARS